MLAGNRNEAPLRFAIYFVPLYLVCARNFDLRVLGASRLPDYALNRRSIAKHRIDSLVSTLVEKRIVYDRNKRSFPESCLDELLNKLYVFAEAVHLLWNLAVSGILQFNDSYTFRCVAIYYRYIDLSFRNPLFRNSEVPNVSFEFDFVTRILGAKEYPEFVLQAELVVYLHLAGFNKAHEFMYVFEHRHES